MHDMVLTEGGAEELIEKIKHENSLAEKAVRWKREAEEDGNAKDALAVRTEASERGGSED